MDDTSRIRIMLLSTDPVLNDLVARTVARSPDIVLTETLTRWEGSSAGTQLLDVIVLLDVELDGVTVLSDSIKKVRATGARVITLSSSDAPSLVTRAMAAGADAALSKSNSSRRLAEHLRLAANRDSLIRQRAIQK